MAIFFCTPPVEELDDFLRIAVDSLPGLFRRRSCVEPPELALLDRRLGPFWLSRINSSSSSASRRRFSEILSGGVCGAEGGTGLDGVSGFPVGTGSSASSARGSDSGFESVISSSSSG